ncbi:MAG: MutS-related protein [Fusicatenibacter saccharivorans]
MNRKRSWYNCGRNGEKSRRNGRHGKRKKNWKRVCDEKQGKASRDAITWNDLDLDAVFDTVDHTVSVCGEEYLYTALRMPVTTTEIREERERLMQLFAESQKARSRKQRRKPLLLMGKEKMNPPTEEIAVLMEAEPGEKGKYLLMAAILLRNREFGLLFVLPPLGVAVLLICFYRRDRSSGLMHGRESKKLESALKAFGCILRLQRTARELGKEKNFGLEMYQKRLEEQEKQLRPITRKCRTLVNTKESQGGAANMIFAYFRTFFLLDLIEYSSVVSGVKSYEKAILQMAEDLGLLDFALSAASYRESLSYYCRPEFLDEKKAGCRIDAEELYHPLLTHPVANSLYAEGGILLTGSNASGKSTFMKNMAVNAILAQALNTSLSKRYRGVVCRIMTSMALRDNLAQGESYFVVEVKSLKRILEASREKTPLLCVIDEVLRGTNTTERIAASESVLAALRRANVLCLAATHDTELTYLLEDLYTNYHFEEQITAQSISFPYRLEQGPARGKNAIALLGNMGIDEKIVKQAERRAAEFETTGSWEKNKFLR